MHYWQGRSDCIPCWCFAGKCLNNRLNCPPITPQKSKAVTASEARQSILQRQAPFSNKTFKIRRWTAAHAIALGATLVTNNERDFAAYPLLKVENWMTP
jgi:predicted nucleic acid-binding protein